MSPLKILILITVITPAFSWCVWDCEDIEINGSNNDLDSKHLKIMTDIRLGIFTLAGVIALVIIFFVIRRLYATAKRRDNNRIQKRVMSFYRKREGVPTLETRANLPI